MPSQTVYQVQWKALLILQLAKEKLVIDTGKISDYTFLFHNYGSSISDLFNSYIEKSWGGAGQVWHLFKSGKSHQTQLNSF